MSTAALKKSTRSIQAVRVIVAVVVAAGLGGCGGTSAHNAKTSSSSNSTLAGTASARSGSAPYYLALGDSLAAGVEPDPSATSPGPKKIKAGEEPTQGYANDLYQAERTKDNGLLFEDLGCPGETTTTMTDGGKCSYAAGNQLAQAIDFIHDHKIAFITIDIGGDNVDGCVTSTSIDASCANNGLASITTDARKILSALRQAAGPGVEIAAMTYYDPFLEAWLAGPDGQVLAAQSVALTKQVNSDLLSAFQGTNVQVADVANAFGTYIPFSTTTTYAGRTVPVAVANICDWTWMCSAPVGPNIHPNTAGYHEIAAVLEEHVAI
jgi:lysophospholipase L1-like esterase